jgi:enamine deaminase RidA (YjgF/YER057c/UK114 family)
MAEFKLTHNPPGTHKTTGYSHAARIGDQLFLSGQVAQNENGEIVGKGDPRAQTEQIYKNMKAVLEACGSGLELVGKITVYTTKLEYRQAIRAARDEVFGPIGHFPASTFVVISSLAEPDYLVEIEAIAGLRD